jgi:hypothetical protein
MVFPSVNGHRGQVGTIPTHAQHAGQALALLIKGAIGSICHDISPGVDGLHRAGLVLIVNGFT